jgi:hypothetical protein
VNQSIWLSLLATSAVAGVVEELQRCSRETSEQVLRCGLCVVMERRRCRHAPCPSVPSGAAWQRGLRLDPRSGPH